VTGGHVSLARGNLLYPDCLRLIIIKMVVNSKLVMMLEKAQKYPSSTPVYMVCALLLRGCYSFLRGFLSAQLASFLQGNGILRASTLWKMRRRECHMRSVAAQAAAR